MISFLSNLRAFFVATLSVCLSLIVFGTGLSARAQEAKSKATGEQQRGKETDKCDEIKNEESTSYQNAPGDNVNTQPLKDWLARGRQASEAWGFDLSKPIDVSIGVDNTSDGSFINTSIIRSQGDALVISLAETCVAALSESHVLRGFKKNAEAEHLVFDFKLDGTNVSASLSYEASSAEKANEYARVFTHLFILAQMAKAGQVEGTIYKNSRVTANGKQVLFNLTISRQLAGELLTKHLSST